MPLYGEGKPRMETYTQMVERTLSCVREGMLTCMACYGHPGVFVYPSHESVRRARAEGFNALMLPGISSEDCLFADLGIDPAATGCQSYEATDFLLSARIWDPTSSLLLWQIGVLGDSTFKGTGYDLSAMPLLVERLLSVYPPTHVMYLYEAPVFPDCGPLVLPVTAPQLAMMPLSAGYTLYVPPAYPRTYDPIMHHRMTALRAAARRF